MTASIPSRPDQPLHAWFRPDAIAANTHGVNARLAATLAGVPPMTELAEMRAAYADGRMGLPVTPKGPAARTIRIPGPGGEIALRILVPETVRGVYLHIHGGGWMLGTPDMQDLLLETIGAAAGLAAVSVDYRLAPEHPFPAPVDDCVAAARWLIAHAEAEFGATWLAIGGESAGAHLAASTLVRLRDAGQVGAFRAANLTFGYFDLSLTPSARRARGTAFVDREMLERMSDAYRGGADGRDPAVSPLYADLSGLPAALFSVGTIDPLVDDTLFMHARWQAAANVAELAVYPGGVHGFHLLGGELADAANARIGRFLSEAAARDGA
ncbi:MAG: alpha/beta hydrolase [Burkholderia gladioli]